MNRAENLKYRIAIPRLMRQEGFWGLYKGFAAFAMRDIPGWGVYFYAFAFLKRVTGINEAKKTGTDNSWRNIAIKIWCGGIAGQISWIVSYPFDVIKTEI